MRSPPGSGRAAAPCAAAAPRCPQARIKAPPRLGSLACLGERCLPASSRDVGSLPSWRGRARSPRGSHSETPRSLRGFIQGLGTWQWREGKSLLLRVSGGGGLIWEGRVAPGPGAPGAGWQRSRAGSSASPFSAHLILLVTPAKPTASAIPTDTPTGMRSPTGGVRPRLAAPGSGRAAWLRQARFAQRGVTRGWSRPRMSRPLSVLRFAGAVRDPGGKGTRCHLERGCSDGGLGRRLQRGAFEATVRAPGQHNGKGNGFQ